LLGRPTFRLLVASWALLIVLLLWKLLALHSGERKLRYRERELSTDPEAAVHPANEIRRRRDRRSKEIEQLQREADLIRDSGRDVLSDRTLELNSKIAEYEEDEELLEMIKYRWGEV
jgi:type I site-specific restriction endonuclease